MNTILHCNSLANEFLGYSKQELLGQKVDLIIPYGLVKAHNSGMTDFVHERESFSIGFNHNVFALNKEKEIKLVRLEVKLMPDFSQDVKLLAVFSYLNTEEIFPSMPKKQSDSYMLLVEGQTGNITGSCSSSQYDFGIYPE
jgi:PAS domain S-box-containing protein